MNEGRYKLGAGLTLFCAALMLFFRHWNEVVPQDFRVFLTAVERLAQGQSVYRPDEALPFKYFPGAIWFFSFLPQDPLTAWRIFKGLSVSAWAWTVFRFQSWTARRDLLALLASLTLAWKGLIETLDFGQMEYVLLAAGAGALALSRRRVLAGSVFISLLACIKPAWGLLLVPAAMVVTPSSLRSRVFVRAVIGFGLGMIFWIALFPRMLWGWEGGAELTAQWIAQLGQQPAAFFSTDAYNQGFGVSVGRWLLWIPGVSVDAARVIAVLLSLLMLLFAASRFVHRDQAQDRAAALGPWFLLLQILNPLGWRWGSMLISLQSASLGYAFDRFSKKRRLFFAALISILFLLQLNPVAHLLGQSSWTAFHDFGVVTAYWLAIWIMTALP